MLKCWICEVNDADSGEHLILHAVMRKIFKGVNQENPVYFHSSKRSNKPVGSFKQEIFKFPRVISSDCNNNKTQKYDEAFRLFLE
jgi:hypothetical protein